MQFHPELENGHGHQLSSLPVGAVNQSRPALLEGCENRMQSFF